MTVGSSSKIRIFIPPHERLNLLFPFACAMALIFALLSHYNKHPDYETWVFVLGRILFLNVTHNVFTVIMLVTMPEIHAWFAEKSRTEKARIICYHAFIISLIGISIYTLGMLGKPTIQGLSLLFILAQAPSLRHGLAQIYGLSSLYSQNLLRVETLTPGEFVRLRRFEWIEKRLFWIVMACIVFRLFFIRPETALMNWPLGARLLEIIATVSILLILAGSYFYSPCSHRTNKTYYLSRLLLFPAYFFISSVFIQIYTALHGVEYWFVWKNMESNSKFKPTLRTSMIFIFFSILVSVLCLTIPNSRQLHHYFFLKFAGHLTIFRFLISTSTFITVTHYYLDSQLFRMRDPSIRKYVGRLLTLREYQFWPTSRPQYATEEAATPTSRPPYAAAEAVTPT